MTGARGATSLDAVAGANGLLDGSLGTSPMQVRLAVSGSLAAYAGENGLQFNLYVRGGTQLSPPLQQAVDSGTINLLRRLP